MKNTFRSWKKINGSTHVREYTLVEKKKIIKFYLFFHPCFKVGVEMKETKLFSQAKTPLEARNREGYIDSQLFNNM